MDSVTENTNKEQEKAQVDKIHEWLLKRKCERNIRVNKTAYLGYTYRIICDKICRSTINVEQSVDKFLLGTTRLGRPRNDRVTILFKVTSRTEGKGKVLQ